MTEFERFTQWFVTLGRLVVGNPPSPDPNAPTAYAEYAHRVGVEWEKVK